MSMSDNKDAGPVDLAGLLAMLPRDQAPQDRELIERAYRMADAAHQGQPDGLFKAG